MNQEEINEKLKDSIWMSKPFKRKVLSVPEKQYSLIHELVSRRVRYFWELYRENSPLSDHDCLVADIGDTEIEILDDVLKSEGLPSLKAGLEYYFLFKDIEDDKFD